MTLNFIHLKKELFEPDTPQYKEAVFREDNMQKIVSEQGIKEFKIWEGIITPQMPFFGINLSFKRIVQDAKEKGLKQVVIAEDDIYFKSTKGWQYYLDNIPDDFDAYFGSVFKSVVDKENRMLFGFSGMTLLCIHERFYDEFLRLKEMNNIDREMGRFAWKFKYMVCNPMVCSQHGGWSFHQSKEFENYDHLLEGRELYNG